MLRALKHRGPDSTGFAVYGQPKDSEYVLRFKVAEQEDLKKGVAIHDSFGSIVAEVAEVSVENGSVRVHKVWCAIDCGFAVHPNGVIAQMESAINYGLTAALYGEITFTDGRVDQSNFHDYQILRMNEAPEIHVTIVNSGERMGGAGEPGTPPIAPAVANAIFAATGKRIRKLPITKNFGAG